MPCRDDRSEYDYYSDREINSLKQKVNTMQKRLDDYANMLCNQCKVLDALDDDDIYTNEVKDWWTKHKIEDAKREEAERKEAERKRKLAEEKAAKERAEKMAAYLKLKDELGI